jgi:Outer membrane protein beta-barrel domain
MIKIVIACLLLISACSIIRADNIEITIHSGWSFIDAESQFGLCRECPTFPPFRNITTNTLNDSLMIGIKTAYFLNAHSGIEGSFAVSPNHDVVTTRRFVCPDGLPCPRIFIPDILIERNMVAYQYDANFLYNLLTDDVQPYVIFGVGGVASDFNNDIRNDFAFNFGGGAKFWFKKIGVRFEVNDHVIPDYFLTSKTEHDLQVQYGFVFKL